MAIISIILLIACVTTVWSCRLPYWPSEFKWSFAGPIDGWTCTRILEPSDPDTWHDNYFCYKSSPAIVGIDMRWSYADNSISNRSCTSITLQQAQWVKPRLLEKC